MTVKSVAVIGAGGAGAAAASALKAEDYFETIRVFERRETAGGTWIYDPEPGSLLLRPGALPPEIDQPLSIPDDLPRTLPASSRPRYTTTPIYEELTTNVPDIAMCLYGLPFPRGPFVPHWIPRQYLESYFSFHRMDDLLVLYTTVEDVTKIERDRWRLTLRKRDAAAGVDQWWQEEFDALVIANGHYSVPYIPRVPGLEAYMARFPGRIEHSKTYRTPRRYCGQRVLVIGNSASGHDVAMQLLSSELCQPPIYVSRRSKSRWDGTYPPNGVVWKPVIGEFKDDGTIVFSDRTTLKGVDKVIYSTGYRASFPFWNSKNGRPLFDYTEDRLINNYQHTFTWDFPTLAFIGMPRVLTFRSFDYQAVAVARLWSGRASGPMPPISEQEKWLEQRAELVRSARRRFHQIEWECGETMNWFRWLFQFAGLPRLEGEGKCPPVLDSETRWAIENIRKYPEPGKGGPRPPATIMGEATSDGDAMDDSWELIETKDSLWFL